MKLSDVVAASGLGFYAEVALILFLGAFVAVLCQTLSKKRGTDWEAARRLPLADVEPLPPEEGRP